MHALTTLVLSTGWGVFVLAALIAAVLAYCANYYLFDHRSDFLRRAAAIGAGAGLGASFVWVHVAVLNMARHGVAPIPGRGDWLLFHQAFYLAMFVSSVGIKRAQKERADILGSSQLLSLELLV